MRRSKLERYVSILEVLIPRPMKFEVISYKTSIECGMLKRYLSFLTSHKLVIERLTSEEGAVYAITDRGLAVFKTLRAQEYFQKLKNILPVIEEASEVEPLLSKHVRRLEEET